MTNTPMRLFEFGNYHTLPADLDLADFKHYLKEVWDNRYIYTTGSRQQETFTREQQTDLRHQGQAILRFDGREIQARNYAGFIQYNSLHLHLLPKIFAGKNFSPDTVFEHLLFYLSYGKSFRFPFSRNGFTAGGQGNLLQLLIHWFSAYTEKILTEKPYQAYDEVQEPGSYMKGKLDVPAYVRHTLSSGQWQELYTRHAPFVYDNEFNRVVKYTAIRLLPLAADSSRTLLLSLLHLLQEVGDQYFAYTDCDTIYINRLHEDQATILQMCRFFLANEKLKGPEDKGSYFAFLLPMERVFEEFVAGFIEQHFAELQPEVQSTQAFASYNGKRVLQIRNDIWLPGAGVILDTKYQCMEPDSQNILSQVQHADLYQMVAYAVSRNCTTVHLIYPQTTDAEDITLEVTDALAAIPVRIHIHLIPVMVMRESQLSGRSVAEVLTPLLKRKFTGILKKDAKPE
jgi:5-methylcytosine-specific restriction enzyme subunit McrC